MTTICVFGDSIAWGANDSERGGWVNRLQNFYQSQNLRVDEDVDVYNLGVSGDNTDDLLKRFDTELVARLSDGKNIIIFATGINDSQFVISKNVNRVQDNIFRDNLKTLVLKAQQYTDDIIFVGLTKVDESKTVPIPWNTDKNYTNNDIQRYDVIIQDVAKESDTRYISMKDAVGLDDLSDGLHPNTNGHIKIFEILKQELGL